MFQLPEAASDVRSTAVFWSYYTISAPQKKGTLQKFRSIPSVSFSYLADLSSCRNVLLRLHKDYVALRVLCAEDHAL